MDFKKMFPHLALLTVALIYGANYVIAKSIMVDGVISSNTFILFRCIAGTALFWLVDLLFVREKVEKKDFPYLMLLAVFGIALNQLCFLLVLN